MTITTATRTDGFYVLDSLDYGFDQADRMYVRRGNALAELLTYSNPRIEVLQVRKNQRLQRDLYAGQPNFPETQNIQAEFSEKTYVENPTGFVKYEFIPEEVPDIGHATQVLVDMTIDTSTTIQDTGYHFTIDTSAILKSAVVAMTRSWAPNAFSRRFLILVVGFIPNLPKYSVKLNWSLHHQGVVNDTSDTLSLGVFVSVTSGVEQLQWSALHPEIDSH